MFDIKSQEDGCLVMSGRFDASQVEKAESVLESLTGPVTADLSALDYISSAGLGLMLKTHKRLLASGHALKLVNLNPHVRNVFHYAGLDQVFTIG